MKFVFLSLLLCTHSLSALTVQSANEALREAFPEATRFESQGVTLTSKQRKELDARIGLRSLDAYAVRYEAFEGLRSLGSAWIDDEIGKHRPITYLVALDPEGKVLKVRMLTYREAHGLEARSPRFTKQLEGKSRRDRVAVGEDLDAISGATLSCKTLAQGTRKALNQELEFQKSVDTAPTRSKK